MIRRAILFDRDGTIIVDAPPNRDPASVQLMPRAAEAIALARAHGYLIGVITNQPGGTSLSSMHERIEELIGGIDGWFTCAHMPGDACACRKPKPGLIEAAARQFRIDTGDCTVVGDIGSDVEAALAAGARAVLVPTAVTRDEEIARAPHVSNNLLDAVYSIVGEKP